jgi:hypothetical protein
MESPPYRQIILETIDALLKLQMKSVRLLLGRTDSPREETRRKGRKRKSLVDLAVEILTEEKRPVHVDELVELLRERHGRLTDRDSLSSALAKKDKQGLRVRRVAPASFAVRE